MEKAVNPKRFATEDDLAECRRLHRTHGTTYYLASQLFPPNVREQVHAVYGFVRVPDEWVDNPKDGVGDARVQLREYRQQLIAGMEGKAPTIPVLRAFCDVARERKIPIEEPLCFLDAMEQDLEVTRYNTFEDLLGYTRGSAAAVGVMMCSVLGVQLRPETVESAKKMGDAMQLTNFLRDVGEDWRRGRLYLPLEDLRRFRVDPDDIGDGRVSPEWRRLMKFQIERTREMYAEADRGIPALPTYARRPVQLARTLYSQILDKIEQRDYDVFSGRAHTTKVEKLAAVARIMAGANRA